jgi:hypothetical protein
MEMLEDWLVPITLFWAVSALFFGGFQYDVTGGSGGRQFLGVIFSYALFLVVWGVMHAFVMVDSALGIVVASAVAALAYPIEVRLGFLLVGAHVRRGTAH